MKNVVLNPERKPSPTVRRYLSLWLCHLPFEKIPFAQRRDIPWVFIEKQKGALRLVACNAYAHEHGLTPGMALAQARAIIPDLHADPMDSVADQNLLLKLAGLCDRFTPLVAIDGHDGLILDVTGCTHLYGGEKPMQDHIVKWFALRHFTLKHAMAGTPDCARALAHFSAVNHISPGEEAKAATPLPITALECSTETRVSLTRAGLRRLGDLSARPSLLLTARFGADLTRKLHRILGHEDRRISPLRPVPDLSAEQLFAEPLQNMTAITQALSNLIIEICALLERTGKGGRSFEATFFRVDGMIRRLKIETARAMREPPALVKLFILRLDNLADPLEAGFGFDALRLSVLREEPLNQGQKHFDGNVEDERGKTELIDRLTIRFGRDKVLGFMAQDSHSPLRAAVAVPIATLASGLTWLHGEAPLPRPLQMFSQPQPIEVMAEVPDGPPIRFRWRNVLHQICAAEGPERIEAEWWRGGAKAPRDYYRIEDENGGRFWVFREGLYTAQMPRWYMQGLFA